MIKLKKMLSVLAAAGVLLTASCKKEEEPKPDPAPTTPAPSTPSVTAKSPTADASNVSLNKVISITFSETMDASTINSTTFTLKQGTISVSGTVAYVGTTATFTPAAAFTAGTSYSASITTGIKSSAGIAISANDSWTFSTGSNATGLAAVDLGTAVNLVKISEL
jgi:hypothetical protein